MPNNTERDLLNEILRHQQSNAVSIKESAKRQLDFAAAVSVSMNAQSTQITKIRGYLENNPETNQKGFIEKVSKLEQEVIAVKKQAAFVAGAIAVIVPAAKWIISKLFL